MTDAEKIKRLTHDMNQAFGARYESLHRELHAAIDDLAAERDALKADAARYRWLLDCGRPKLWRACADMNAYDDVDEAINNAMKEAK